jgi:hypothetical protein
VQYNAGLLSGTTNKRLYQQLCAISFCEDLRSPVLQFSCNMRERIAYRDKVADMDGFHVENPCKSRFLNLFLVLASGLVRNAVVRRQLPSLVHSCRSSTTGDRQVQVWGQVLVPRFDVRRACTLHHHPTQCIYDIETFSLRAGYAQKKRPQACREVRTTEISRRLHVSLSRTTMNNLFVHRSSITRRPHRIYIFCFLSHRFLPVRYTIKSFPASTTTDNARSFQSEKVVRY